MTPELAVEVFRRALYTALLISAPMLGGGLLVGLAVSILQAVTQIHEMTLTFIPKILVVALIVALLLPWMTQILVGYTLHLFELVPSMGP